MYQQFQNPIASTAKWIFFGFFGVILMGFLLGANIKEATWLNSGIAEAQAQRIQIESAHQLATYELQERKLAAQTDAEIHQIQRDQEKLDAQHKHDLQVLDQDIANRQRWADFKINAVTFMGIGAGVVATISILILVVAKAIVILRTLPSTAPSAPAPRTLPEKQIINLLPERQPYEPLDAPQQSVENPSQLYDRRVAERFQEITQQKEARALGARMKAVMDPARMSKEEYN
ncbi:hypothetical protein HY772_09095, partial [Candidatus Woesearchaeota archaeon]|nr:hypothetical protein [Candidatus Woesearchaeota archaeon]